MQVETRTLDELLAASVADAGFKAAVRALDSGGPGARGALGSGELIAFDTGSPPVKILRVVTKLLEEQPDLAIERVQAQGTSGCGDFRGRIAVQPGDRRFDFVWDCKWRAEQLGWDDPLGLPDQIRAARELGYQCFEKFEEVSG